MKRIKGVILIEALVAILIVALGMLGIVKLEGYLIASTGLAKARAEAMALAEDKIEETRAQLDEDSLIDSEPTAVTGTNATFTVSSTITDTLPTTAKHVDVTVSWTDERGAGQSVNLQSLIAWEDPKKVARLDAESTSPPSVRPPTGQAERGKTSYPGEIPGTPSNDGVSGTNLHTHDGVTELIDTNTGKVILYLKPNGDVPQQFATISGRIYLDIKNPAANADDVLVRLSSEGQCFYKNQSADVVAASSPTPAYFPYICYVGPAWYGNVGVLITSKGKAPKICVGSSGVTDNRDTTSPHATPAYIRTYRGFKENTDNQLRYSATGVAGGSTYPDDGYPRPTSGDGHYLHDFVLTESNKDCSTVLATLSLPPNFGRNVCISPDSDLAAKDVCPSVWPGYSNICMPRIVGGMFDESGTGSVKIVTPTTEIVCNIGSSLGNRNFECLDTVTTSGSITVRNWFIGSETTAPYCYEKSVNHSCLTQEIDFRNEIGRTQCAIQ